MIDMSGVRAIQARIMQLQQKFGISGDVPGMNFQHTLQKAMDDQAAKPVHQIEPGKGQPAMAMPRTSGAAPVAGGLPATAPTTSAAAASSAYAVQGAYEKRQTEPAVNEMLSELVQSAAQKYQVDPKLVSAIAEVESGGNQSAISPVGAIGVMQLMPGTAASLGVDPYDERQNIEGGAKYLHEMLETFGGDIRKAVAAYNAGPQAVKEYGGVPPYRETQDYVNKVLDLYR